MFDLTNLRTNNCDQLHTFGIYELTEDWPGANGRVYPRGMEFWFDYAIVNVPAGDAEIHGLSADEDDIVFFTKANHHKTLFGRTWREWRPKPVNILQTPPPLPGGERAWLAGRPGFESAHAILAGQVSRGDWGASRRDGDTLAAAARSSRQACPAMARWLADQALHCYHSWMSQATSGGEGTAMQYEIRSELEEMRELAGQ